MICVDCSTVDSVFFYRWYTKHSISHQTPVLLVLVSTTFFVRWIRCSPFGYSRLANDNSIISPVSKNFKIPNGKVANLRLFEQSSFPDKPKLESHHEASRHAPVPSSNGGIRYRSPSSLELEAQAPPLPADSEPRTRKPKQNSVSDKISQIKRALLLLSIFIVLFVVVFYLAPRRSIPIGWNSERVVENGGGKRYAVVFDAGSSGSRVHVYCFDERMDLVPIGNDLEIFLQKKPGLSSYSTRPKEAAYSLSDLLEKAESVVPAELRHRTPVRVGATAGLRALGLETSERILQAVRTFLHDRSSLKFESDWVTVLDGTQEGAFQWVTINYLLGNLGKEYSHTVGVVDLGGGSVQMAYAISKKDATNAPKILNEEDEYVKELFLKGSKYHLYVHSYLHFGLLAARAEILKADDDHGSSCILAGYHGLYKYGHSQFQAAASPEGPSYTKCRASAIKALKTNELCTHLKCTFGGVWNGGGGDGQKNLFVASFFFDRAAEVGFVDPNIPIAKVKPHDFAEASKQVCETRVEDAKTKYSSVEEESLPYLCMDLVYQFTLLVDGFGLDQMQEITLVKKVKYGDFLLEAAWPLGSAIEVASSG